MVQKLAIGRGLAKQTAELTILSPRPLHGEVAKPYTPRKQIDELRF